MNAPKIDVLAVLDSLIEYHDTPDSLKGRNCIAARAAVAELIEAAKDLLKVHSDHEPAENCERWDMDDGSASIRMQAALARVGGAA